MLFLEVSFKYIGKLSEKGKDRKLLTWKMHKSPALLFILFIYFFVLLISIVLLNRQMWEISQH